MVINGLWHEQSLEKKINIFTATQQYAFKHTILHKEVSQRNTKPRWLVDLIQKKRRLQNKLRSLASDTRIIAENTAQQLIMPNLLPQPTQLSPSQFIFFSTNIIRFKKEINYLGRKILRHRIILQNDSWNKSINKLAETDIKTAPKEFYSTMKRLGGLGKGTSHVTKMTYGPTTANSEIEVANLMAQYVEDSFKPLEEPDFDYSIFDKLKQEWDNAQTALENSTPPPLHTHWPPDHTYANTNSLPSPILQNTLYSESTLTEDVPNTTKHQRAMWGLPNFQLYKNKKEPLPPAPSPNLPVDENWTEQLLHNSPYTKNLLKQGYQPFDISELEIVLKKMKRKAPGHDGLVIDCFQELGMGGKHKLLDIANEIYATGNFPSTWKQAIMIPILKKNKAAKDPASYRPISLLPVGGKIVEALILKRFSAYISERQLIPCIQTGFRPGQGTDINLKRMYNRAYTRSTRSTHPTPTIMIFFDAKKAFDSVWDIGVLHKAMKDGLPAIFCKFLRTYLSERTMQVRIGQTLSKTIKLLSGVPQGSVFAPTIWNYYTGDIPPPISVHSDTAVYADDASIASTHPSVNKLHSIAQNQVFQLSDWTNIKRIKFEPKKTHVLAIHPNPATRNLVKE